jgi:hypothetical protein
MQAYAGATLLWIKPKSLSDSAAAAAKVLAFAMVSAVNAVTSLHH